MLHDDRDPPTVETLQDLILRARLRLLKMHFDSRVGHLGGNLSAIDLLVCLYHRVLGPDDQFVLSKGHAAGALYVALWSVGALPEEQLQRFHASPTLLSAHPPAAGIPQVLFGTGSLGHGPSLGAGLALGKRMAGARGRVIVLTSDGEWNEGSCWEAIIFARQQKLQQLTLIVDANGLQGFGTTREVADLSPLAEKFRAFGWATVEINGHDPVAILQAFENAASGPRVVIAHTCKGCGISFMEHKLEWHYLPLSAEQYAQAVQETRSGQPGRAGRVRAAGSVHPSSGGATQ